MQEPNARPGHQVVSTRLCLEAIQKIEADPEFVEKGPNGRESGHSEWIRKKIYRDLDVTPPKRRPRSDIGKGHRRHKEEFPIVEIPLAQTPPTEIKPKRVKDKKEVDVPGQLLIPWESCI